MRNRTDRQLSKQGNTHELIINFHWPYEYMRLEPNEAIEIIRSKEEQIKRNLKHDFIRACIYMRISNHNIGFTTIQNPVLRRLVEELNAISDGLVVMRVGRVI